MGLNERIGARGELLASDVASVSLFAVPPFLYRELLRRVFSWICSPLHASASATFEQQTSVIYLASYIRHRYRRWRMTRSVSHVAEMMSFGGWLLRTAFARRPKRRL